MRSEKGAILIEAILGLTIATIIITALVSVLVSSLSNATFSRNQTFATGYAQEAMELTRSMKDDNYLALEAKAVASGIWCFDDDLNLIQGCTEPIEESGTMFDRQVILTRGGGGCDGNSIYVEAKVSWSDSKCTNSAVKCHDVTLKSCFSNLDYVPL